MKFKTFIAATILAITSIGCSSKSNVETTRAAEVAPATDSEIASTLKLIEKSPDSAIGYVQLGAIYVRRARETGDFSLNSKAETAVEKALAIAPQDVSARKLQASLHLTFHRFDDALAAGRTLLAEFPTDPFVYGVLTDANAELGDYKAAVDAAQKMVDLRPNSNSYARVAHLRSLHGDHAGAVEMFKTAARTADPQDREAQSWCLVQLGDEFMKYGAFADAEKTYDEALANFADYHFAITGKARARAAQGDFDAAATLFEKSFARVANVETAILLGDVYARQGNGDKAARQYELVEAIEEKLGVSNDRKRLALMWADQDRRLDDALAITERESALRKDIFTADAYAWTLYKKGRLTDAKAAISRALTPRSNDARILYHAAMIEKDLGDRGAAKKLLAEALKLNPAFDLVQTERARRALAEIK